jgi:hypothetical protein
MGYRIRIEIAFRFDDSADQSGLHIIPARRSLNDVFKPADTGLFLAGLLGSLFRDNGIIRGWESFLHERTAFRREVIPADKILG